MNLELTLRGETRAYPLHHGLYRIGGHNSDDLRVAGLAHRIATLRVDGAQVLVTAATNLRVGNMVLAARTPHLLHPNEAVCLDNGLTLRLRTTAAEPTPSRITRTVQSIRGLLSMLGGRKVLASLTCTAGRDMGNSYLLAQRCAVIGRGIEAEVQLSDQAVSRRHLRVLREHDGFKLEVMPSTNGVYVNGKRVSGTAPLKVGDVLEVGSTLLRFGMLEGQSALSGRLERTVADPRPGGFSANVDDVRTHLPRKPAKKQKRPSSSWLETSEWPYVAVGASLAAVGCASTYALLRYFH